MKLNPDLSEIIYPLAYYNKADIDVLHWIVEDIDRLFEEVINTYEEHTIEQSSCETSIVRALHITQVLQEETKSQAQRLIEQLTNNKKLFRENLELFFSVERTLSTGQQQKNLERLNEEYKGQLRDVMITVNSIRDKYQDSKKEVQLYLSQVLSEEYQSLKKS